MSFPGESSRSFLDEETRRRREISLEVDKKRELD
jgi:hypothetical protein